jgi:hypothetical protein
MLHSLLYPAAAAASSLSQVLALAVLHWYQLLLLPAVLLPLLLVHLCLLLLLLVWLHLLLGCCYHWL